MARWHPMDVDGDAGALDRQHVEQLRDGKDLVRLLRDLDLAEHEPLPRCEGRDHVDRELAALSVAGAARGLSIDCDDVAADDLERRAGQARDPGDEAALEGLGVERGEDVAYKIVRGRAVGKRLEAT